MKEIYKDIPGYEGLYQVSNLGDLKSFDRLVSHRYGGYRLLKGKNKKATKTNIGYLVVNLSKNGKNKTFNIHQLVAMAFLNHIPEGHKIVVDHIDNNKTNNRLDNLQLITPRENTSKDKTGYTSEYIGVSWNKKRRKWVSTININGQVIFLGRFNNEYEAHLKYQEKLKML